MSPAASPGTDVVVSSDTTWQDLTDLASGGPRNQVRVTNRADGRFRAEGSARLHRIGGERVTPSNSAFAESSCTDCQSIAVAVQVVLYRRGAATVAPTNAAVAINTGCTRCVTVARAIQYVLPVDDPKAVPKEVDDLVKDLDREMQEFEKIKDMTKVDPEQAEARYTALVQRHQSLVQYLSDLRDVKTDASSPSPTPSGTGTPVATATADQTRTPGPASSATPSPSAIALPGSTPRPTPSSSLASPVSSPTP